ncbi:ultraviolet-B receptor UVR8 isoform X1 [Arachis stenosperma]|uniref:ultraviolet-B receptor UVR8 isoform X1 n=2 Tax=Arachis stenosperma TaxID=217475 RepID=UPI0025AC49A5|nr:ultraviolet-B receptor UVR8 isoform X1 [Arachis stenosperma]
MDDAGNIPNSGNPSHKAIAVTAGEAHTLLLTGDGSVYSWGRGMFGRLGHGSEKDELLPVQVKFQNPNGGEAETPKIVAIASGAYHNLALADDGSVWSWGYNIYGQLGTDGEDTPDENSIGGVYNLAPHLLNKFPESHPLDSSTGVSEVEGKGSIKIHAVKAGGMMSMAIDNRGTLWMWGNCPQESKGEFSLVSSFIPMPILAFHGLNVAKVACGNEHVVALVSAGESNNGEDLVCYSWGVNNHGQLGLGDRENRAHPEVVKTFGEESPWTIYDIACGAAHTALLTRKKKSTELESKCWTFGLGDNGQLGHGTTQSALFPTPVQDLPQDISLIGIDCGLFHTSVVSSSGDVWSWGMEKGLGLCPDAGRGSSDSGDALSPLLKPCAPYQPKFPDPVQVACGAAHTVIVARDGYKVWSWGRGRCGVLGTGNELDCYTPTKVRWPPATEDSEEEEAKSSLEQDREKEKEAEVKTETDEKLSSALNELKQLQLKLSTMEQYASILHGCVFGKPFAEQDVPASLKDSGSFNIAKEWENMLETADHRTLMRLEMFYRDMLAGVKDKQMKRRIKEIVKECLQSPEPKN